MTVIESGEKCFEVHISSGKSLSTVVEAEFGSNMGLGENAHPKVMCKQNAGLK